MVDYEHTQAAGRRALSRFAEAETAVHMGACEQARRKLEDYDEIRGSTFKDRRASFVPVQQRYGTL